MSRLMRRPSRIDNAQLMCWTFSGILRRSMNPFAMRILSSAPSISIWIKRGVPHLRSVHEYVLGYIAAMHYGDPYCSSCPFSLYLFVTAGGSHRGLAFQAFSLIKTPLT